MRPALLLALPWLLAQFGESPNETMTRAARIGVAVEKQDSVLVVRGVEAGTSAESSGLRIGDQILRIDFEDVASLGRSEVAAALRGAHGSRVTLTVLPRASMTPRRVEVVRDVRVYLPNEPNPGAGATPATGETTGAAARKPIEARFTGATLGPDPVPDDLRLSVEPGSTDVAICLGALEDLLPAGFPSEFAADFTVTRDSISVRTEPASGDLASCLGRKAADWKLPRPGRKEAPLRFRTTWSWSGG